MVQISDLHIQSVSYRLKQLAKELNRIKPDLVMITGGAVDNVKHMDSLNQFLLLIDHDIKKIATLGNWEYCGHIDLSQLRNIYDYNNCDLLINESRKYTFKNKSISVTGVDDFVGGEADIELALKNYQVGDCHIVLNHCPQYSDTIASVVPSAIPADFILSGHTHGGQINLFGFIPFRPRGSGNYLKGWYKDNKKKLYVSKGVGTSIVPLRFMARAEIAVFNIIT